MVNNRYANQAISHGMPIQLVNSCSNESELLSVMLEYMSVVDIFGREGDNPPTLPLPQEWQD